MDNANETREMGNANTEQRITLKANKEIIRREGKRDWK